MIAWTQSTEHSRTLCRRSLGFLDGQRCPVTGSPTGERDPIQFRCKLDNRSTIDDSQISESSHLCCSRKTVSYFGEPEP